VSVLAMPLSLGIQYPNPIDDVEALVRKILGDRLRQFGTRDGRLSYHDEEEAVTYLIGVAYECERRYDPAKERNPDRANFAAYASKIIAFRVADWYRQRFGDTRHGEKPIVLSLDAPASLDGHGFEEKASADRLVDTLPASTGDPAVDRAPELLGILHGGDRPGSRTHAQVGEPEAGGAAGRTRRPAAAAARVRPRIPGTRRPPSRPPICPDCFNTFLAAFTKVNQKLPIAKRLTIAQLEAKAAKRARAVRFGEKGSKAEWACPRHTKLEDEKGHQMMLAEAYPNRAGRRAAVGKGVPKNRKKSRARASR
jgi:hypothetical protein